MTATAAIKRGTATKRKTAKIVKPTRRTPSMLSRLLARMPISAQMLERAITVAILSIATAGLIAIAIMLNVPRTVGVAMGEAVGRAGFSVKHIDVSGIDRMDRMSVYAVALDQQSIAMPLVDLEGVRQKLLKYGWVADARVSRRLPDTLAIEIVERKPAAIWQHSQQLTLVDAHGVPLEPVNVKAMPDLPLVIGPDANVQATALTALMDHAPQLRPVLDGAVWIGDRRWDLKFQSGETLMLPEGAIEAAAALKKFADLDAAQPLLGRGMARFDMRNPDQMAVLPGPKKPAVPSADTHDKPIDPALAT